MRPHSWVRFLASVGSKQEAQLAAEAGADVIDCKNPHEGALGALTPETITEIRGVVPAHIAVSATIGDVPFEASIVAERVTVMAAAGADIVKIGLFASQTSRCTTLRVLTPIAARTKLIAVMLADDEIDREIIPMLGEVGFCGLMLDTQGKTGRTLVDFASPLELADVIEDAHKAGLLCGLAGSLRKKHIPELLKLAPDVLGFRGALCTHHDRMSALDRDAVLAIRQIIPYSSSQNKQSFLELSS